MRVLVAHNAYRERGGEDAVAEAEVELLRAHGHEVRVFARHNDEAVAQAPLSLALQTLWSRRTVRELRALLADFRPEVVHAHNTFPLISPSLYWAAHEARVPVVQTLHNFRLLCPQAMLLREGRVCEDCVGTLPWRGVLRGCYRGSVAHSAVLGTTVALHRAAGTWAHRVRRYIALNQFCRDKFVAGGLPAARIRLKPNFVALDARPQWDERAGGLFVGRLSAEKGVELLAAAAAEVPHVPLTVIGDGPGGTCARAAFGARWLGRQPLPQVLQHMQRALYLVLPSLWYENFPRTLVEAFACGLPAIASRLGALAEIVRDGRTGLLFDPGQAGDLASKLAWAEAHPEAMKRMGRAARAEYEARYTPARNHAQLLEIYRDALGDPAPAA